MGRPTRFPYPGGERAITAGCVFLIGLAKAWPPARVALAAKGPTVAWLVVMIPLAFSALGVALWCRQHWARLPATVLAGLFAVFEGYAIATKGGSLARYALMIGLLVTAWGIFTEFTRESFEAESEGDKPDKPLVSLVLLLRKPRHLEAGMLARYCEAAWGGTFRVLGEGKGPAVDAEPGWVGGRSPFFFVGSGEGVFLIHNHDQPYFEDVAKLAESNRDLRIRQVLEENRGWMAVDFMESTAPAPAAGASFYPQIARLVAELAGPDCQAVYQPDGNHFNHWDESLEAELRAGDVAKVFAVPTRIPVISVADDDPRMAAAVEEARRQWPDFVQAFGERRGSAHTVKVPITAGDNTEYIWVEVERIEDDRIHGRLGNDPVDLGDLRLGTAVDVPVSDVRDWMYLVDGEPKGGFGLKVLSDVAREQQDKES